MYLFWKKNQTGKKYYYLGENKKIKGKSVRVKEIYIGSPERLYALIGSEQNIESLTTYEYGLTIALLQVIHETGLYEVLKDVLQFKIRGVPANIAVIIALINKIISPKPKNSLHRWYKSTVLCKLMPIKDSKLTSQFFFELLRELTPNKIERIEYRMSKHIKTLESLDSILCDMTSIETYIQQHENNTLPQRGRTRTNTGRRLVNLALLITRESSIPLFHIPYSGNINAVTEFANVLKILEKRYNTLTDSGNKSITIMIDKGNNNESNINGLEDAGYYFVGRLKPSSYPSLLAKPLVEFKDIYEDNKDVISYSLLTDVYGRKRKLVVKYDKQSYEKSYQEFMDLIERREQAIRTLQNSLNYKLRHGNAQSKLYWRNTQKIQNAVERILNKKPTKNLFTYALNQNDGTIDIKVVINKTEYDKRLNLIGKYIIFTNRVEWDHNKIIKAFIDQYLIEDQYKTLKGERIKIQPLHHWTDNSIRADIFLSVLALQVMNLLLMKVKKKVKSLSSNQILDSLENIKVSYYKLKENPHEFDVINEMPQNENRLFSSLKLSDKNTFSYIKRAFFNR
jgi:transposase